MLIERVLGHGALPTERVDVARRRSSKQDSHQERIEK